MTLLIFYFDQGLLEHPVDEAAARRLTEPLVTDWEDRARDLLPAGLRETGAEVNVVVAYRTVAQGDVRERVLAGLRAGVDLVTFASPSAVENFVAAAPEWVPRIAAAVIGPVTEEACRRAGIEVHVVAAPATVDGLARALERRFKETS